jgi:hypothetical protein
LLFSPVFDINLATFFRKPVPPHIRSNGDYRFNVCPDLLALCTQNCAVFGTTWCNRLNMHSGSNGMIFANTQSHARFQIIPVVKARSGAQIGGFLSPLGKAVLPL